MDGAKIKTEGISGIGTLIKKKKKDKAYETLHIPLFMKSTCQRVFFFSFPTLFNILER